MSNLELMARERAETGKNNCRRLRATGRVPAVLYGLKSEPENLTVNDHEFMLLLYNEGLTSVIDLKVDGQDAPAPCIIKQILRDPVSSKYLHIDFLRMDMLAQSTFMVEVVGVGTPVGVKEGGILETANRHLEIRCLPTQLPHAIEVDITDLKFGASIHASELTLPEGLVLLSDPDMPVFSVLAPRGMEDEPAADAVAEPEVVGKKKESEEE